MPNNEDILLEVQNLLSNEQYDEAKRILEPLVHEKVPKALALMGFMYQLGLGVERNGEQAIFYLSEAMELGEGSAAHNLGTIYHGGMPDIPANAELSKDFYRKAKQMGAQFAPDDFYE